MKRTELNLAERRHIEDLLHRKVKVTEIARRINRHRATVYREIKRNFFKDDDLPQLNGYFGMTAQRSAAGRRARRRKLVRISALREALIDRLQEGWSPEQIAGRLKFEGQLTTVSHETIYAYVYSRDGQSQELARYLPNRRKKRKPRYARTSRDTPISTLSDRDMKAICERLNGTPRKCLGWQTPTEAFAAELRKLR